MKTIKTLLLIASLLGGTTLLGAEEPAAPAAAPATPKHFLIVLRPVPRLHEESAWTEKDNAAVYAHFTRLQEAVASGSVILAGRTDEPLDRTFGLIVLRAADDAAARAFMEGDPCVQQGVMTAELHPYGLALLGK